MNVLSPPSPLSVLYLFFFGNAETLPKKENHKEKQWFSLSVARECERSLWAEISQPLISIQPHLLLCLVVTWLLMCDWQAEASMLIGAFLQIFSAGWLNTWLMDRSGLHTGWVCLAYQGFSLCCGFDWDCDSNNHGEHFLCDDPGWLAGAGSIGFYFARYLGFRLCLPV